jgi:hypothetical protein
MDCRGGVSPPDKCPIAHTGGETSPLQGHREDLKLRIWRLQGAMAAFRQDLIAR